MGCTTERFLSSFYHARLLRGLFILRFVFFFSARVSFFGALRWFIRYFLTIPRVLFHRLEVLLDASPLGNFRGLRAAPFRGLPRDFRRAIHLVVRGVREVENDADTCRGHFLTLVGQGKRSPKILPRRAMGRAIRGRFRFSQRISPVTENASCRYVNFFRELRRSLYPVLKRAALR